MPGKYVVLIDGLYFPKSTIVSNSKSVGKRQPVPGRDKLEQYVLAASQVLVVASSCFCHTSPVTLSVIVPLLLSVYDGAFIKYDPSSPVVYTVVWFVSGTL